MKAKYVMTDKGLIVFPLSFSHSDFKSFKPTSAGFINFYTEEIRHLNAIALVGSEALNLESGKKVHNSKRLK
jgi:hypothetical protein